jgi:hypothetical protein
MADAVAISRAASSARRAAPAPDAAPEATAAPADAVAPAALDRSEIAASLLAEWGESFERWAAGGEIRIPQGAPGAVIPQEERVKVLFSRMARGRLDARACASFTAQALVELLQPEMLVPTLRRILCGILNYLPEITERPPLVQVIAAVLLELCFDRRVITARDFLDLVCGGPDWPYRIAASRAFVRQFLDYLWEGEEPIGADDGELYFQRFRACFPDDEKFVDIVCDLILASERVLVAEVEQQMSAYQIGLQIYARLMQEIETGKLPDALRELFRQANRWTANLRPERLLLAVVLAGLKAARDDELIDQQMYENCVEFSKSLGVSD